MRKNVALKNIDSALVVKFDANGCLEVPNVKTGMTESPENGDLLRDYGQLLRTAQTSLDRINTAKLPDLAPGTSEREREIFETLRRLNAEVVLRILTMRDIALAGLTRR